MKKILLLVCFIIFILSGANATFPFQAGEKFEYDINWSFVTGGKAVLEILSDTTRGDSVLIFQATARSSDFVSNFYYVKNVDMSYYDINNSRTVQTTRRVREGSYRAHKDSDYNYNDSTLTYIKTRFKEDKTTIDTNIVDLKADVMDIISAFYHVRTLPLEVGKSIILESVNDGKFFKLKVDVLKKKKVKTAWGKKECFVVRPLLIKGGLFEAKGDVYIYLTDDDWRIPVLLESKVVIGKISVELTKYRLQ